MCAKEQARKLALARIIAAGPPAGSGINVEAWRSWHEYECFVCPRYDLFDKCISPVVEGNRQRLEQVCAAFDLLINSRVVDPRAPF